MKKFTLSISLLVLLAASTSASASASASTSNVPRGCSAGGARGEVCVITFGEIWGGREHYSGRTVALRGYLASGVGGLTLYPSRDFFFFQNGAGGVAIRVDEDVYRAARSRMSKPSPLPDWDLESPCPASVVGVFDENPVNDSATLGQVSIHSGGLYMSELGAGDAGCGFIGKVES